MDARRPRIALCVLAGLTGLALTAVGAQAAETNHYPNGTSGILGGSVPGPGEYYVMYNLLYRADQMKDGRGHEAQAPGGGALGFDATAFANVHRYIQVTDHKFLGAEFSWNIALPIVYKEVEIGAFGVDDGNLGIGDLNIEPLVLEWRGNQWDFGVGYGLFAPTGGRSDLQPALPGKDYWTHYGILAGTWFFDPERTIHASFLSRYEWHGERDGRDITPGNDFSVEWGIGRSMGTLTLGVSGFAQWQMTRDSGTAADRPALKDQVFGIGPELQYFFPDLGFGVQLRHWQEFGAEDRTEGSFTTLTFVKPLG